MLRKHSVSIRGHRTSYSIEDAFYQELVRIAAEQNISLSRMITQIDFRRSPETNLSSALRLHVLDHLKSGDDQ